MEPEEKRQKSSLEPGNETVKDRISELPDSILSHILSKLPTKHATGTAVLSSRWKNLFPQIPNLKINLDDSQTKTTTEETNANFIRFMYNLLTVTLRDVPHIQEFYVLLKKPYPDDDINAWISAVIRLNLSNLGIFFQENHVGISSDTLFCSKSLLSLILFYHNFKQMSDSILLPNLKTLLLFNVTFANSDLFERAISACPVLESLSVLHCKFEEVVNVFRVSSRSVKQVKLSLLSDCCGGEDYDVELDMPDVGIFYYEDNLPKSYCLKNLSNALVAHIDVGPSKKQYEDEENAEEMWRRLENVRDLVGAFSDVLTLFLSNMSTAALGCSSRPLPAFRYLMKLKLGSLGPPGWEVLPQLLASAPNLETLVFKMGFYQCEGCFTKFMSNLPRCLALRLHTIKFEAFNGEEDELELVAYFLNLAHLLRKIKFQFSCSLSLDNICSTKSRLWSLRSNSRKSEVQFAFKVKATSQP